MFTWRFVAPTSTRPAGSGMQACFARWWVRPRQLACSRLSVFWQYARLASLLQMFTMPATYPAEDCMLHVCPSTVLPIQPMTTAGSSCDFGLQSQPSFSSNVQSLRPASLMRSLSNPHTKMSCTYCTGLISGMSNFANVFAKSSVAITGLCVHPKGKLGKPQTSSITPILIALLSSSDTQHDQNMLATFNLHNHMLLESRAASRNVSPRFSRVGSLMRCPGAAHLALRGTMFIMIAPLEADLYLVKAFALGLLPSRTRSMSPPACTLCIIAASLISLLAFCSAAPSCLRSVAWPEPVPHLARHVHFTSQPKALARRLHNQPAPVRVAILVPCRVYVSYR